LKIVEDQRKHTRKRYSKRILFSTRDKILSGITKDISPAGVFIKTHNRLKVGQTVTLVVPLKNDRKAKILSEIIWDSPDGFGVKFLHIKKFSN
jgi:Tfp pilus assembly protein PilZ